MHSLQHVCGSGRLMEAWTETHSHSISCSLSLQPVSVLWCGSSIIWHWSHGERGIAELGKRRPNVCRLICTKLQVAARGLFAFDSFKECFEVAFAEAATAFALDDLVEERRAIFYRTGEDLKHIAFVVAVYKDAKFF